MTTSSSLTTRVLITQTSERPSAAEVKRFMSRLFGREIPDAAVSQLIGAIPAVNRWLADHPEGAGRLLDDPAATLEAIQQSGAIAEPLPDLLAVLQSAPAISEDPHRTRARIARVLRPRGARFGERPALRFSPDTYGRGRQPKERGGR